MPGRRRSLCAAFIALLLAAFGAAESRAVTYYWDADAATTTATGGTENWGNASSLWRVDSGTGTLGTWPVTGSDNDANLGGTAGTLTLTTGISVNDITVNPSPSATYTITGAQTLTLNGAVKSVLDVASGSTLTITSGLAGLNGFTKSSAGTLILDSAAGTATLFGGITVNGGTLQAGSATNNGASQVLRSNTVTLAGGTSLTTVGTADLRVGSLSGSGSVTPASGKGINELALADATFSGTITTTGGLNLRGAGAVQTFSGTLSGLTGAIGINGVSTGSGTVSSGLTLSGSAALGNSATVELRGGSLVLDNTGSNTGSGSTTDRLGTGAISSNGGTISLIGNATNGSDETVGSLAYSSGATTINVTHNGGSGGTVLTLGSATAQTNRATINFTNSGGSGTLGSSGANPRILITSGSAGFIGEWAVVNAGDYATYDTTNGVKVATYTAATTSSNSTTTLYQVTDNLSRTSTTNFGAQSVQITTTGTGKSLAFSGSGNLGTVGVLLSGTNDYTISSSASAKFTGGATRYIGVADAATTLNISMSFGSPGSDIVKYGDGFLNLTGDNSGSSFLGGGTSSTNTMFYVNAGTLRVTVGTTGALYSGGSNGRTSLAFRGGVLEISNGADGTGTSADFGFALGTGRNNVNWENGSADRGNGGFSAITNNASVNIGGNSTPSTLTWNSSNFVQNGYALVFGSAKADKRITFLNPLALDNGTASSNYFAREIRVADNTGSANDVARLSGVISGSANADLLKTGDGVLELTNTNTYSGNTLIQQGTLSFSNVGALTGSSGVILSNGTTLIYTGGTASLGTMPLTVTTGIGTVQNSGGSGSTLTFGGTITKANTTLTFTGSGNFIINGLITGGTTLNFNSDLNVVGTTVTLTNANNDYTGPTNVSGGGTLIDGVTNAIPTGSVATLGSSGDGAVTNTLDLDGFDQTLASLNSTSNGGGTNSNRVTNSALGTGTNTLTLSGVNSASAAVSSNFAGILQDGSTARIGLQITGGMHTLSGANSFSGGTTLTGGTLIAGNNSAVGSTGAQTVTFNGGKLASDNDARSLANNIVVNVAGNQITGANSVTLTGAASGPGTLEIALTNVAKSVTVTPASANSFAPDMLRLTSGTLLLGGSNKIGDSTKMSFSGGALGLNNFSEGAAGSAGVGSMSLSATSILDYGTLGAGANAIAFGGVGSHTAATVLQVTNYDIGTDHLYFTGATSDFSSAFAPTEVSFNGTLGYAAISFSGYYEIVAVPEPTTVLGAAGLFAFLAYRERRRVRRLWSLHVAPPLILLGFLLVAFVTKDTD